VIALIFRLPMHRSLYGCQRIGVAPVISGPASTVGVWLHDTVLVLDTVTPPHAAEPVTVSLAVKVPLVLPAFGVKKYACAGLLFCVQVRIVSPPVQMADE
jgi:hypothetical protein